MMRCIYLLGLITVTFGLIGCLTGTSGAVTSFYVAQHHPEACDEGAGTFEQPFKTISRAAAVARPGDTVVVHEGVYRETVAPARGGFPNARITYMAQPGERVVISAADLWYPYWEQVAANVYRADLDPALFDGYNPFAVELATRVRRENFTVTSIPCYAAGAEIRMTLGQLIVDGELYQEVSSLSDSVYQYEKTWMYYDDEDRIYVHFPTGTSPEGKQLEITAREQCFAPTISGLGYITVRGFVMKYAGNQNIESFWNVNEYKQNGALSTTRGNHWIIEDNVIKYNKSVGIDFGNQTIDGMLGRNAVGYHQIRNNIIYHNGISGLVGWSSRDVLIEDNLIMNNNSLQMRNWEMGGLKTHHFDGTIRGNVFAGNYGYALWMDNQYSGARVTQNVFFDNWDMAIFIELGRLDEPIAIIDHNIIIGTKAGVGSSGYGIYSHDANRYVLANNLIVENEYTGIRARRTGGDRAIPTSEIEIFNNIIAENGQGAIDFPAQSQWASDNVIDQNLFDEDPRFILSGNQRNFDQWRNDTDWDAVSAAGAITDIRFDRETMVLEFMLHVDPAAVPGRLHPGIDQDFYGIPVTNHVLIGPFQALVEGYNRFELWPDWLTLPRGGVANHWTAY